MKGFKDSTKTKFGAHGSACYAKGGSVNRGLGQISDVEHRALTERRPVNKGLGQISDVERRALTEAKKPAPVKKSLGGLIKKLSPLAAIASGDDSGIGGALKALSPAAMLLAKKKKNPIDDISVTQVSAQPTQMKRGGKVKGGLAFASKPMFGK
jgi:hypothetical protein